MDALQLQFTRIRFACTCTTTRLVGRLALASAPKCSTRPLITARHTSQIMRYASSSECRRNEGEQREVHHHTVANRGGSGVGGAVPTSFAASAPSVAPPPPSAFSTMPSPSAQPSAASPGDAAGWNLPIICVKNRSWYGTGGITENCSPI
eukprot:6386470-Prymnesium_polylepis.2